MIKILLYGGCHALVLRDLLEEMFDTSTMELSLLINFHLIASGEPFPYERLEWCDVFIYSPIENKGDYNTDLLLERCHASNARPLCFPWMEWHGYCPGATKGLFKGRFQWYYPELLVLAEHFDRFETFASHALAQFPDDAVIDRTFSESIERLAAAEARHAMPLVISDFIKNHFRTSRLFLISDHPSIAIYLHVIEQIVEQLGLRPPSTRPVHEPQWRWRTPIFPKVATRLGLAFADTHWVDDELVPGHVSNMETYLSLYFHRDSVILGPIDETHLQIGSSQLPLATPVDGATRIVASPLAHDDHNNLDEYVCWETLSGMEIALEPNTRFAIDTKQWRSTWDF